MTEYTPGTIVPPPAGTVIFQATITTEPPPGTVDPRMRMLLLAVRQSLLIVLGAVESYLCMERSVQPKHKRDEADK